MIGVKDIRLIVNRLLKRERVGSTVSGADFNRFLAVANAEETYAVKSLLELSQDITDGIRTYIKSTNYSPSTNYIQLPADYLKILSVRAKNGLRLEDVDVLTQMEYSYRKHNSITRPTVDYPVCYEMGDCIYFDPVQTGTNTVVVSYMCQPAIPYLDYYVNLVGEEVYLDESETVDADLIDSDFKLYGKDGQALTLTGSPLSYDSTTVEMDWPDESNRVNIMKRVLVMCGVSAPDQLAIQYGAQ